MKRLITYILLLSTYPVVGQTQVKSGADILLDLQKLNNTASVLYIAAHPDDENTRLLSYLATEKKVRTGYLSLTRGDGGQNLIGTEQGELLGLVRTQELLAARRTDGAEQFFTRANDFGFSKNPEETFAIWNKDSILSDVVLCIRKFRPDVIICRFPTTGEGGHGHHTASAILAMEAFEAAADAGKFPNQLKEAPVWQATRIFWNTFNFGGTNTTAADQLKIDVGVYNPLLGKSYGEIAAESRSMHKSQGFGSAKQRGSNIEYFKLLKGSAVKDDLFDDIVTDWKRFKQTERIQALIADCIMNYRASDPSASVRDLLAIHKEIAGMKTPDDLSSHWKQRKLKDVEALIFSCAGLWFEAAATDFSASPGSDIWLSVQALCRDHNDVKLTKIRFPGADSTVIIPMKQNELYTFKHKTPIPAETELSTPYWLRKKHEAGRYEVPAALIGKAENDAEMMVDFSVSILGVPFTIQTPVIYKSTDPVKGEIYRPFTILPPATVNVLSKVLVFPNGGTRKLSFLVRAQADNINGSLVVKCSEGWKAVKMKHEFSLKKKNDEAVIEVEISSDKSVAAGKVFASLEIGGKSYNKSIERIDYDHIPKQVILSESSAKLILLDIPAATDLIGYIPGAGDEVLNCLTQMGYQVNTLNEEQLSSEDLSKYKAIVTGVRAYNTNDRLQAHYDKLMSYVSNGGNLIVQYNTNNRIGPVQARIGPYPFTISRDRVTDEKAEVRFKDPAAHVLNVPNKITTADFDNWVQERGIYFATETDPKYQSVFSINDPNEKPSEGSLIIGAYGKGNFVYTGLAFFRELPAGVPGAYRLFMNLISLPQNDAKK